MKKIIIIFGLWVTYTQANIFIDSLKLPDSREEQVAIVSSGEGEIDASASEPVVKVPPPEPEFTPLAFTGKLTSFSREYGGRVVKAKGTKYGKLIKTSFGLNPKKIVIVGVDYYFAYKGTNYVIHRGKLIKL